MLIRLEYYIHQNLLGYVDYYNIIGTSDVSTIYSAGV